MFNYSVAGVGTLKKLIKPCLFIFSVNLFLSGCTSTEFGTPENKISTPLTSLYSYQIMDSASQTALSLNETVSSLEDKNVIFVGEFHSHQGAHLLQLQLLEALYKQNPKLILSMEQFTRDAQPILDKYLSGEYGEATLIDEGNAWDHYKGSYRAVVEFARKHDIPVIAANSPAMHVRCVGQKGMEVLASLPKNQIPWSARTLDFNNEAYKNKFLSFIKKSGRSHGQNPEEQKRRQMNTYAAQLLRDTTMAESVLLAMEKYPRSQVVHLNGSFHSDNHLGTVTVLENMNSNLKTTVFSPVTVKDDKNPSVNIKEYAQGDFIYLLQAMPERYVNKSKRNASIRKLIGKRMQEKCEL
ncbi:MAG: ChaN family lipoprotein [Colwelliaceae bacterium]|nr:ChaN family lipoprotein [Colwelliaceae bacterium]